MLKKNMEIDVVITWVDGDEPILKKKRNQYIQNRVNPIKIESTRFNSVNEIKYCVLSILKFASFVRNIFIITDEQTPNIFKDIKASYPDRLNSIRIIDHKEIFRGYEEHLPTFNSISIETVMWRIKDLSENFVYFNDDFFLINEVKPQDWFINGNPVIRGKWKSKPSKLLFQEKTLPILRNKILKKEIFFLKPIFKISQYLAANKVGYKKKYFRIDHTPHPINKNRLEKYFLKNKEDLKNNLRYKFRNYHQFNIPTLANHLEIKDGNKNTTSHKNEYVYLKPFKRGKKYVDRKISLCSRKNIKFMCAQSLDIATKEDREKILLWLDQKVRKKI